MENKKIKTFEEFIQTHKSNNTCLLYAEYLDILKDYSYAEVGILFLSILYYIKNKISPPGLEGEINGLFKMIKQRIDFDTKKYQETCYKNYLAVSKGRYNKEDDFNNSE